MDNLPLEQLGLFFPVAHCLSAGRTDFRVSPRIEAYPWASGDSIHHRQSVCAAKSSAVPTGPPPHLKISWATGSILNGSCGIADDETAYALDTKYDGFYDTVSLELCTIEIPFWPPSFY